MFDPAPGAELLYPLRTLLKVIADPVAGRTAIFLSPLLT
jgi:hypothetical protein